MLEGPFRFEIARSWFAHLSQNMFKSCICDFCVFLIFPWFPQGFHGFSIDLRGARKPAILFQVSTRAKPTGGRGGGKATKNSHQLVKVGKTW